MGSASGHDFEFHVASWLDVSYQWHEGTFYPRWTAWTNHGFGEPRYIFYPPLSWMLGAALTRLVPLAWVPACYVILVQTLAGLFAYFLLRKLTSERGALLGAACYVANPNALLITYVRSDFAEQLACAFFPLLLLGALRLTGLVKDDRVKVSRPSGVCVAICGGVVVQCASRSDRELFGGAGDCLGGDLTQRSWKTAVRGAAGIALGFGLIGFYLVPAAYEQRWVNISQALASGLLPWQNFLFTSIDDVEHTWFNFIASWCAVILMLLVAVTRTIVAAICSEQAKRRVSQRTVEWLADSGDRVLPLLMLRFTNVLWMYLPKLRFVQFPWRWMSYSGADLCLLCGGGGGETVGLDGATDFSGVSVPLAILLIDNGWWDPDEMPTQQAAITSGTGYDGTDEYDPVGDDHLDLPLNAPLAKVLSDTSPPIPAQHADVTNP